MPDVHMFVGVGAVKNAIVVEDNSTQLTLTWKEPFHSQDVISLYYIISVITPGPLNNQDQNTTNTFIDWRTTDCGQYWFTITAYGNHGGDNFPYEAAAVTVDHNVTFSGGKACLVASNRFWSSNPVIFVVYQVSGVEDSIEIEYQGLDFCNADLTILVRCDSVVWILHCYGIDTSPFACTVYEYFLS